MALKPEDPSGGFQHGKVVDFINEKMAMHVKGPEFYLENTSLSWAEVEDKLRVILEDSAMPSEAKEACAWGSLALGVRFARRQGQLHACRVQWLQDFSKLHKSAAQVLASNLKELRAQQEMECKEAAFRLRLTQVKLAEVQKERDLLRWKLFRAVSLSHLVPTRLPSHCPAPTYLPHPHNWYQRCPLLSRSWRFPGSRSRSKKSQAWPLTVGLGKEQVRREKGGALLLLLLQLGVLLERKTRIPGVRGCKLAWWRPCTDWGRG